MDGTLSTMRPGGCGTVRWAVWAGRCRRFPPAGPVFCSAGSRRRPSNGWRPRERAGSRRRSGSSRWSRGSPLGGRGPALGALVGPAELEQPAPDALAPYVTCLWEHRIGGGDLAYDQPVLPDGCIDLVAVDGTLSWPVRRLARW